jgi:hypothetical protein
MWLSRTARQVWKEIAVTAGQVAKTVSTLRALLKVDGDESFPAPDDKAQSSAGDRAALDQYRIVYFATHGLGLTIPESFLLRADELIE